MEQKRCFGCGMALLLIMGLFTRSHAKAHISGKVLEIHGSRIGRNLGPASNKTPCPIDFEKFDYKPMTDTCKAPDYDPVACCSALQALACPYVDQLNDVDSNDCAAKLFYFIDLNGKYPDGLFFRKCNMEQGLDCP